MSKKILLTQEIGSFRKPEYLSRRFRSLDENELNKLATQATKETIEIFEKAGLDNIGVGGEMFRWEMYEHPVSRMNGITVYGPVRSFDNKYYNKGSVVGKLGRKRSFHAEEIRLLKELKKSNVKIPITGPYTLMDWSFNEYYGNRYELSMEFGKIINEEIREIKSIWGDSKLQIQIDEPATTTHPSEMDIVKDSINESLKNISGVEAHLHVCYSKDYGLLFNIIPEMNIDFYNLEFANRDSMSIEGERIGFYDVKKFKEVTETTSRKIGLGLGVTDVHINEVETTELIASRIKYALKFLEPEQLRINPDCGLRTRSREIGYQKLRNMTEARDIVVSTM